jgi:hypothetical protein
MLDASAMTALFDGHEELFKMLQEADAGRAHMFLPAVAVAEAETMLRAGYDAWGLLFFAIGVEVIHLDQSTAIELGSLQGPMGARHAMHEARAVGASVVTRAPGDYAGLPGALTVV